MVPPGRPRPALPQAAGDNWIRESASTRAACATETSLVAGPGGINGALHPRPSPGTETRCLLARSQADSPGSLPSTPRCPKPPGTPPRPCVGAGLLPFDFDCSAQIQCRSREAIPMPCRRDAGPRPPRGKGVVELRAVLATNDNLQRRALGLRSCCGTKDLASRPVAVARLRGRAHMSTSRTGLLSRGRSGRVRCCRHHGRGFTGRGRNAAEAAESC